jgi:hypothetical protein
MSEKKLDEKIKQIIRRANESVRRCQQTHHQFLRKCSLRTEHFSHFPIVFLMLPAGCTEQLPVVSRDVDPVPDPIVETQHQNSSSPVVTQGRRFDVEAARQRVKEANRWYKVIGTVDGNTIDVLADDKETIRLRLNRIDAPERGQPFGNNAAQFVSTTAGGRMVRLRTHGEDKYERTIADIYLPVDHPVLVLPDLPEDVDWTQQLAIGEFEARRIQSDRSARMRSVHGSLTSVIRCESGYRGYCHDTLRSYQRMAAAQRLAAKNMTQPATEVREG